MFGAVFRLTARYNNPNKIHEKVVEPEVVGFRPAVRETFVVMIKHACGII